MRLMTAPVLHEGVVTLRPPTREDRDTRQRHGWWAAIERGFGHVEQDRPMTDDEADAWVEHVLSEATDTWWVVEVDGEAAGVAFLHRFEPERRRARYAVGLFHPELLGRGIGSATTRAVLRHGFDDLGLLEVELRVLEMNDAAIRCYEACGFRVTGREPDTCELHGELYDDFIMTAHAGGWPEVHHA